MITALGRRHYTAGGAAFRPGVDLMIIWVDDVGGGEEGGRARDPETLISPAERLLLFPQHQRGKKKKKNLSWGRMSFLHEASNRSSITAADAGTKRRRTRTNTPPQWYIPHPQREQKLHLPWKHSALKQNTENLHDT